MYQVSNIEDLEKVYSCVRLEHPNKKIHITYDWNTKKYSVYVTNERFDGDPDVPLDLNIEVVYGDSVTGSTPLVLRNPLTDYISIKSIETLCNTWFDYPEFKLFDKYVNLEKQYGNCNLQVWSDKGWASIKKVIRHKTNKDIFRVVSTSGVVDVTEDHSLFTEKLEKISPKNLNTDTLLLTHNFMVLNDNSLNIDSSFVFGVFFACGEVNGIEWSLRNIDSYVIQQITPYLQKMYPYESFQIENNNINTSSHGLSNKFKTLFYTCDTKSIPSLILNSSKNTIEEFLRGYELIKKASSDIERIGCSQLNFNSQLQAQSIYYLLCQLGYNISINEIGNTYWITYSKTLGTLNTGKVKKIYKLQNYSTNFVYDLETDVGRFQAGIGNVVVSNTDSIFMKFEFNRNDFEENRKDTFKLATICGNKLTKDIFDRPPIVLEFEKVFQPFILLTKKRYIAKKFENMKNPFELKGIDAKGIALTRRDYCNMVKKCYKSVIDTIMADNDTTSALKESTKVYFKFIEDISSYSIPLEDLVISAQIGKEYSCRLCKKKCEWIVKCEKPKCKTVNNQHNPICCKCKTKFSCLHEFSLPHISLAQKMLKRNEEVQIGDRLAFAFIENDKYPKTIQKFDLAEDPKFIVSNNLKLNRLCYIEQLAKPLLALYKVCLQNNLELLTHVINKTNEKVILFGGKPFKINDFKIDDI